MKYVAKLNEDRESVMKNKILIRNNGVQLRWIKVIQKKNSIQGEIKTEPMEGKEQRICK
jgi:hypothetical protein